MKPARVVMPRRRPRVNVAKISHVNPLALVQGKKGLTGVDPVELAALPQTDQLAILSAMSSAERRGLARSVQTLAGLGEFNTELGALGAAATAANAELVECTKLKNALQAQVNKRTQQLKDAQAEIARLTADLAAAKNAATSAAAAPGVDPRQVNAMQAQLAKRTQQVEEAQAKASADAKQIADLKAALDRANADLTAAGKKQAAMSAQLAKRTGQVVEAQNIIANSVNASPASPAPATVPAISAAPTIDYAAMAAAFSAQQPAASVPNYTQSYGYGAAVPFAASLDAGGAASTSYGFDPYDPGAGYAPPEPQYEYYSSNELSYEGGDSAGWGGSGDQFAWDSWGGYMDDGMYGLGCAWQIDGPCSQCEPQDEIVFGGEPQLGSWLSSAFKSITGTKLSDVVGAAANAIPVVGPIVAGAIGAASGGGGGTGTAPAAGGVLTNPGVPAATSAQSELEKQNAAMKQQLARRTAQVEEAQKQIASLEKSQLTVTNPVVLAGGAALLLVALMGGRR